MNKAKKWILGTTGALLLLLLFYFFKNRPPRYNWMETYQIESKEPYGGFLLLNYYAVIFQTILSVFPKSHCMIFFPFEIQNKLPITFSWELNFLLIQHW